MLTRKQKAGIVAAVLTVLGSLAAGLNGQATANRLSERVRVLEVTIAEREKALLHRLDSVDRQLENVNFKLDRLIERGR
ncbi:MAG TPA: hypothetical protein VD929_04370 [Caulobacteraceae bacterium]|nr:hypothetical protein [Caulobacteraceae bacterium]